MIPYLSLRQRQALRFLRWVQRYPGWWYLICTPGAPELKLETFRLLLSRLAGEGFYEMVFVLLMVHRNHPVMANLNDFLCLDFATDAWARGQGGAFLRRLIRYFD